MSETEEMTKDWASRPGRHIVSLSGGKDSTALALYLRDKIPQLEYIFCDTHKELPETYEYIERIESYLQKPVMRLNPRRGFDHWLDMHKGMLPNPRVRWCTHQLKLKPFEEYVGDDLVWSYIGIRADENRSGYLSTKPNIKAVYPFKEHGLVLTDIQNILAQSGLGLPSYYEWRSRSGCYFCFYQRTGEWIGLRERHYDLFQKAKEYENENGGEQYTWRQRESLAELEDPERMEKALLEHQRRLEEERKRRPDQPLIELQAAAFDAEEEDYGCLICHL